MEKYSKWDLAEVLRTKEDILAGIEVAIKENDNDFLMQILNALPRSAGAAELHSMIEQEITLVNALEILRALGYTLGRVTAS